MKNLPAWLPESLAQQIDGYLPWPIVFVPATSRASSDVYEVRNAETLAFLGSVHPTDTGDVNLYLNDSKGNILGIRRFSETKPESDYPVRTIDLS